MIFFTLGEPGPKVVCDEERRAVWLARLFRCQFMSVEIGKRSVEMLKTPKKQGFSYLAHDLHITRSNHQTMSVVGIEETTTDELSKQKGSLS